MMEVTPVSEGTDRSLWNPLRWPFSVWCLLAVVALFFLPFVTRWFFLASVPEIATPFDEDALIGAKLTPEENAFTEYQQAVALRKSLIEGLNAQRLSEPNTSADILEHGWEAADEEMINWLEKHREALAIWRRGTTKDRVKFGSLGEMTFATSLVEQLELRSFGRLAMVDQVRCLHEGNVVEAWELARAVYRTGGHATNRGPMISGLVGIALHAMASAGVQRWSEHPAVSIEQLKQASSQIRADFALYEPESTTFKVEYLAMRNSMRSWNWMGLVEPLQNQSRKADLQAVAKGGALWLMGEPDMTVRISAQILGNLLPEIDKPLSERRKMAGAGVAMLFDPDPRATKAVGQLDVKQIDRAISMSFLSRFALPATKTVDDAFLRFRARQTALEMLLTLQIYRWENGHFPEGLDQLVPKYLEVIPFDPCDPDGGTMLYRRDSPLKAVVYSRGLDRNDGGGDVVEKGMKSADIGFELRSPDEPR